MNQKIEEVRRQMAFFGALLFAVGLFTGIWTAMATTGMVLVPVPHLALAAHLNGLLGGLWLLMVSYSFEFLNYSERQLTRLFYFIVVPCWFNWFITLVASFWGVKGLDYSGDVRNNLIAFLLQILVVAPALFGSVYWVRGFLKKM